MKARMTVIIEFNDAYWDDTENEVLFVLFWPIVMSWKAIKWIAEFIFDLFHYSR